MEYENEDNAFEVPFSNRATVFLDYVWSEKFHPPPPRAILGQWDDTTARQETEEMPKQRETLLLRKGER